MGAHSEDYCILDIDGILLLYSNNNVVLTHTGIDQLIMA